MIFSLTSFEKVAPHVYVAVADPAAVNIGLVVGAKRALVIDTGSSPTQGNQIREHAEALARVPVTHVLVTHWHWDHYFGLAGFAGGRPVTSYGHTTLPTWLEREEVAREAQNLGVNPKGLVPPRKLIREQETVDLGGVTANIHFVGLGHTDGDLVVFVPEANVLFAGDLVEESGPPAIDFDSHPSQWPATLDRLLARADRNTLIIPGHGRAVDSVFVHQQKEKIAQVAALDAGMPKH